jgi:hypothetical protein
MLVAVAGGMERRDAPAWERRLVSAFVDTQFADSPEALYVSGARIAKAAQGSEGDPPKTDTATGGSRRAPKGDTDGMTAWFTNRCLSACEKPGPPGGPRALVVMGPPGSGVHKVATRLQGGCFSSPGEEGAEIWGRPAVVSEEDFRYPHRLAKKLLTRHLNVQMCAVSKEARRLERGCLKALVGAGANIVWLTRGEQKETVPGTLGMIRSGGYGVETVFLAAPGKVSAARALFEYEWLKWKTGMAFMPLARCHRDSLRFLSHTCLAVEEGRLADSIRVLDGEGIELYAATATVPALRHGHGTRPHDAILREQSKEISTGERRRCLEMLAAVADGMDSRGAPLDERYMVAAFIRSQFLDDPEALHISKTRIAKGLAEGQQRPSDAVLAGASGC